MKYFLLILTTIIIATGCKNDKSETCATGRPLPIFTKNMQIVKEHKFTSQGQSSQEEISLANGIKLEIYQQGCDTLNQSFRFGYNHKIKRDSFVVVVDSAISQFKFLSKSDEKLKAFALWSDALTQIRNFANQGELINLGQGINLKIDHLEQAERSTILIDVMQISSTHK